MKINNIYIKYLFLILPIALFSCAKEMKNEVKDKTPIIINSPDNSIKGEIIIKFKSNVAHDLEKLLLSETNVKSGLKSLTKSGISSMDLALRDINAEYLQRVFPIDKESENLLRASGLNLWYEIKFSENEDINKVAERLTKVQEIDKIEFSVKTERPQTFNKKRYSDVFGSLSTDINKSINGLTFNQDPMLEKQWHYINDASLNNSIAGADVRCLDAWKKCTGDASVIVAVMDEGVDWSHPDLQANMWINENETYGSLVDNDGNGYAGDRYGYNFAVDNGVVNASAEADTGHGTHVAGTIGAVNGNGIGVSGIAGGDGSLNSGVKLMSVQIMSGHYSANTMNTAKAIKYAADNGAVILQCSWGYISAWANPVIYRTRGPRNDEEFYANMSLLAESINYFVNYAGSATGPIQGGLVIFASGNEFAAGASYPSAYKSCISVSAIAGNYSPTSYTNYGEFVDISAPGGDSWTHATNEGSVLSTLPERFGSYGYMDGTSMACPHVSGVAALGLSYAAKLRKHFTAEEFKKILLSSVEPVDQHLNGKGKFWYYWSLGSNNDFVYRDLEQFKGTMGSGIIDADRLLAAIDNTPAGKITLSNIYIDINKNKNVPLDLCFEDGRTVTYKVTVDNANIAHVSIDNTKLVVKGLKEGVCTAIVESSKGEKQTSVITVRKDANNSGWL